MGSAGTPESVLEFWFGAEARKHWWAKSDAFDEEIRTKFGDLVAEAVAGQHVDWRADRDAALALTIVLDQLTRNIYRGTPQAFSGDPGALATATEAIVRGFDRDTVLERRMFLYMPFEHSELLAMQERSVELFTQWASEHDEATRADALENLEYARRHHEIIARFGRFPHRNAILGRESTPEEIAFLKEPGSSF